MGPIDKLIAADRATPKRIAVVGDAMTDVYVHGRLEIGQEDCPKFVEESREMCDGGAANAKNQISNWNCWTNRYSFAEHISPFKTRFLVNGKCVFRHDEDRPTKLSESIYQRRREIEFKKLQDSQFDAVLISDYDKGFLTPEFIRQVIDLAAARGVLVVADAKRHPRIYEGVTILKGNKKYQDEHGGTSVYSLDVKGVVFTHGGEPPRIFPHGQSLLISDRSVPVLNHVGAGDCFAAHLVLALAHGLLLEDAAAIAHSAGRVYVQHPHNRPPWPHEIKKDIDPVGGKVVSGYTLSALRQSVPGRIVFTNGVFRLPHAGHAWLMTWAKQQGDVLVVGVNDDASAARVKDGYCMPLSERLAMLASLEAVDWVVPFADDTPHEVLRNLKADVLVKGNEYAGTEVPGAELVNEVRFAPPGPFPDRRATTLVCEARKYAHVEG